MKTVERKDSLKRKLENWKGVLHMLKFRTQINKILLAAFLMIPLLSPAVLASRQNTAPYPPNHVSPSLPEKFRCIVKLKKEVAIQAENSLSQADLEIRNTSPRNMYPLFQKHKIKRMLPLYQSLIRWKKQTGKSEKDFVTQIKKKYYERSGRYWGTKEAPEVSLTYILEPDVKTKQEFDKALDLLKKDPGFEYVEPDQTVTVQMTPNDPYFLSVGSWGQPYDDLYGLKRISAPAAWDLTTGSGVVVAVVDTGLDGVHPDIAANVWNNPDEIPDNGVDDDGNGYVDDEWGWDFANGDNHPQDDHGHGTHVAGVIAAIGNNGTGIIGVAPGSKVMAVKGLDQSGRGYDSWLAEAIIYAANNGAEVINNSWIGTGSSKVIEDAVNYAHSLGVVVIAGAGNDGKEVKEYYPAALNNVITVAASEYGDGLASFSNWGNKIDVAAPGVDILSLRAAGTSMGNLVGTEYTRANGTSMAAPHVAGLAALILARHPEFSNEQVRQVIRTSAQKNPPVSFNPYKGYGRIDALGALSINDLLEAHLESPGFGSTVTGSIPIIGSAKGLGFSSYLLEYGPGNEPTTWNLIQQGYQPVDRDQLGVFNAALVPDGTYTIRLTVWDQGNPPHKFEDRMELKVDYVALTDPVPPAVPSVAVTFKPGTVIPIYGTVTGATLQRFRLEWAEGLEPTQWSTTGFTLENGGFSPIQKNLLANWDSSVFPGRSGYYQIRLLADNLGFTSEARTIVYLDRDLMSGNWPQILNTSPTDNDSVSVAKDENGQPSLVITLPNYAEGYQAGFNRYACDGTLLYTTSYDQGFYYQAAVGNLDGNPGDETVIFQNGLFRIIKPDNTFDEFSPGNPYNFSDSPIVLQDLNGDSLLEIMALGKDEATKTRFLYAWYPDGSLISGQFPVPVLDYGNRLATRVYFLVADLDQDGLKEIIAQQTDAGHTSFLSLFNWDGTPRSWSGGQPFFPNTLIDNMATGDLNHDGQIEIILSVFGVNQDGSRTGENMIYLLGADGSILPGWPVQVPQCNDLGIGDLDRDGTEEIVISGADYVRVLNSDGTPFSSLWPIHDSNLGRFSIGDVNGDGFPEIVISKYDPLGYIEDSPGVQFENFKSYFEYQLMAIDNQGRKMKTWRIPGVGGEEAFEPMDPLLGDLDADGKVDIAVNYGLRYRLGGGFEQIIRGALIVFDLEADYQAGNMDWPINLHDPQNSAVRLERPVQAVLTGIGLNESCFALQQGETREVVVTATFSNGRTLDVTKSTILSTADPGIASVDAAMLNGLTPGSTTLTAMYEGLATTAQVVVAAPPPVLTGIHLDQMYYEIPAGLTKRVTVTATYSDNSVQDVTSLAMYHIEDSTMATVDESGMIRGLVPGYTSLTVIYQEQQITVTVIVSEAVATSLSLDKPVYQTAIGLNRIVMVNAVFSDGSVRNVSGEVDYLTTDPQIATVDSYSNITAVAPGITTLIVSYQGQTATAQIVVEKNYVTGLELDAREYSVIAGLFKKITVTAIYSDGERREVTNVATYEILDPAVASVSEGKIQGLAPGYTVLIAQYQGSSATAMVYVDPPIITSIRLDATRYSILEGSTREITVTAIYSDNSVQDITGSAGYLTDDPAIAIVEEPGKIKGLAPGSATLTVFYQDQTVTALIQVGPVNSSPPVLTAILPQASQYEIPKGLKEHVTVTATYSDNSVRDITGMATYQMKNTLIAVVDAAGFVKGLAPGATVLTVSFGGQTVTVEIVVQKPVLMGISLEPVNITVPVGAKKKISVRGTYSDGSRRNLTGKAAYQISDPRLAVVDKNGMIKGLAEGSAMITITVEGKSAEVEVVVTGRKK